MNMAASDLNQIRRRDRQQYGAWLATFT